jgi:hypothetical protein
VGHLDTLYDAIDAAGTWGQRHVPDWTFADVPYHLTYFGRELFVRGLELGAEYPQAEQERYAKMAEIGAWNAREFAKRPPGQTPRESIEQSRAVRDRIRSLTAGMTDEDLSRPFYLPLLGMGWVNAGMGLMLPIIHSWSEFTQLRIHAGQSGPIPSTAVTNTYLGAIVGFMGAFMYQQAAQGLDFTLVYEFTDPGISPVTFQLRNGVPAAIPGHADNADLVIIVSVETFEKVLRGIQNLMDTIQSGAMQVSNMEALGTFGKLFPGESSGA